jgi:Skp family chaperone for outer membrane proteins
MTRRWPSILLILAGCGGAAAIAGAVLTTDQSTPGNRVAVIDVIRIFNECQRQKDLEAELKTLQESLDAESRTRKLKIDQTQAELNRLDPSDPAYTRKMEELMEMQIQYKNWFDFMQAKLTREVSVWSWRIYRETSDICATVAKQNGIDLVLYRDEFPPVSADPDETRGRIRSRMVVYNSPEINITQAVLEQLDAQYRAQPAQPMIKP